MWYRTWTLLAGILALLSAPLAHAGGLEYMEFGVANWGDRPSNLGDRPGTLDESEQDKFGYEVYGRLRIDSILDLRGAYNRVYTNDHGYDVVYRTAAIRYPIRIGPVAVAAGAGVFDASVDTTGDDSITQATGSLSLTYHGNLPAPDANRVYRDLGWDVVANAAASENYRQYGGEVGLTWYMDKVQFGYRLHLGGRKTRIHDATISSVRFGTGMLF